MAKIWQGYLKCCLQIVCVCCWLSGLLLIGGCGGSDNSSASVPVSANPSPGPSVTLTPPPPGSTSVAIPMPVRTFTLQQNPLKLLTISTAVAGRSSELLLDTGSSGIRILASATGASNLRRLGIPDSVVFGDGTRFDGELALAPVSIGPVATNSDVVVQLVDQVSCTPGVVTCPGERLLPASGTTGILGVSLGLRTRNQSLYNPLTRLPASFNSGYIVSTGGFNSRQGTFTLGLTPQNIMGFVATNLPRAGENATFEDGTPIWDDAAPTPLYTISNSAVQNAPGRTLFDSGTSDIILSTRALGATFTITQLDQNRVFSITLPNVFTYRIQVGSPITPGQDRVFLSSGGDLQLVGMPFFFDFETYFDTNNGRIGFRR